MPTRPRFTLENGTIKAVSRYVFRQALNHAACTEVRRFFSPPGGNLSPGILPFGLQGVLGSRFQLDWCCTECKFRLVSASLTLFGSP